MICFDTKKELEVILKHSGIEIKDPAQLAQAIWDMKEKVDRLRQTVVEQLSEKEIKFLEEWRASRIKKERKRFGRKREAVQLKYFGAIHQLRKEGYSYAEISSYLAKYHKIKIDQSSIQRYYTEQLKLIQEARDGNIHE